jgi:hypothetical protein
MSERDRARKARTNRMRPDLPETEGFRRWREMTQRQGSPAKQPTEPSESPPPDPERSHPIPESQ